jgi:hypothetical protein
MRIQYMQVMLKEQVAAENACGRVADEVAVLTMLDHPTSYFDGSFRFAFR